VTAREIVDATIADKATQATPKRAIDLQAAILVALRITAGWWSARALPARWRLKDAANLSIGVQY